MKAPKRETKKSDNASPAEHGRKTSFSLIFGGMAVGALIAAYFFQPILRFADPVVLATGGLGLGLGAWTIYRETVFRKRGRVWIPVGFAGTGVFFLALGLNDAASTSRQTDEHCSKLQHQILEAEPEREAAAAAFSALGCRPQFPRKWPF